MAGFRNALNVDFDSVFKINTGGYNNSGRRYIEQILEEYYEDPPDLTYEFTIEGDFICSNGQSVLDRYEGLHMGAKVTNTAINDNMRIRVNERELEYVDGYGLVVTDYQVDMPFSDIFRKA